MEPSTSSTGSEAPTPVCPVPQLLTLRRAAFKDFNVFDHRSLMQLSFWRIQYARIERY